NADSLYADHDGQDDEGGLDEFESPDRQSDSAGEVFVERHQRKLLEEQEHGDEQHNRAEAERGESFATQRAEIHEGEVSGSRLRRNHRELDEREQHDAKAKEDRKNETKRRIFFQSHTWDDEVDYDERYPSCQERSANQEE